MNNGLYVFEIADQVAGVVVLNDGCIQGGDSIVCFVGTYKAEINGSVRADVIVRRHSPGASWLLMGLNRLALTIAGAFSGNAAELRAHVVNNPHATSFQLRLRCIGAPMGTEFNPYEFDETAQPDTSIYLQIG